MQKDNAGVIAPPPLIALTVVVAGLLLDRLLPADVLRALTDDADLIAAQKKALDITLESLSLQRLSYSAGKSDLLLLLDAERAYQQARLGYGRAKAQRFLDTALLFVAMGGGWWQADHLVPALGVVTKKPPTEE